MKLLRNPIFTTGLVIVAIAVVFYQLATPRMRMRFGRIFAPPPLAQTPLPPVAPASTPAVPPAAAVPKPAGAKAPAAPGIDREYAELHFDGWVEWPQRDPFLLLTPDPDEVTGPVETNSPVSTWKLRAIWAQTGSRLAVINHGAYREGDEIEGYRVDHIDTGGVWFVGPHERERLDFNTRPRPPATNPPAAKPPPQPTIFP